MKNKEFENILNECLERLLVKGESLEQCLERYPEQAAELKPLLETALVAREASTIQPRPDFKARARYQFRSALQETAARKSRPSWGWFPRWATVVTVVLVLVLVGGSTVVAADSSMPDSPLYQVKLATEQVRLTLNLSQMGKARLCVEIADRRVTEIAYMAEKGDVGQLELITRRLDERLETLVVLVLAQEYDEASMLMAPAPEPPPTDEAPPAPEVAPQPGKGWSGVAQADSQAQLRDTVVYDAAHNRAVLRGMLDKVPERARLALLRAIAVSEAGYDEVLEALEQS
jgi:hypothetical protein